MQPDYEEFLHELFYSYYKKLYHYVFSYLHDKEQAEDIVQDTFHEAVNHIDTLIHHPAPDRWLRKTAKYKVLNYERTRKVLLKHLVSVEDIELIQSPQSFEEDIAAESPESILARVENAIGTEDFHFLMRFVLDNASHSELAREYGITVWASAKRLSRIRAKLSKEFPGHPKK